jgi:hypothetical protein
VLPIAELGDLLVSIKRMLAILAVRVDAFREAPERGFRLAAASGRLI